MDCDGLPSFDVDGCRVLTSYLDPSTTRCLQCKVESKRVAAQDFIGDALSLRQALILPEMEPFILEMQFIYLTAKVLRK